MEERLSFPKTASIVETFNSTTSELETRIIQYTAAIAQLGTEQEKEIRTRPVNPLLRNRMAKILSRHWTGK